MPELPDITVFREALERRVVGRRVAGVLVRSPFLLRSVAPEPDAAVGRSVVGVERLGKRVVLAFERELFFVIHLMIAGRLRWKPAGTLPRGRIDLAAVSFEPAAPDGAVLVLTEAGTMKRASLHVVDGRAGLEAHRPGGLDVFAATGEAFMAAMRRENRTLKRALTSPRIIDGIGNAYSDEILHAARLSPFTRTREVDDAVLERLLTACRDTLTHWTSVLRREFGLDRPGEPGRFPREGEITAFRPGFAVHGRFGQPCPVCGTAVQRVAFAENEMNYCPRCQTGGRLLADRSLSRLLREDWPRTIEELEAG